MLLWIHQLSPPVDHHHRALDMGIVCVFFARFTDSYSITLNDNDDDAQAQPVSATTTIYTIYSVRFVSFRSRFSSAQQCGLLCATFVFTLSGCFALREFDGPRLRARLDVVVLLLLLAVEGFQLLFSLFLSHHLLVRMHMATTKTTTLFG